jgi:hypothetical protein
MRFPGRLRGLGCCQPGGDVSGEGVQFRVGREHLADPQIKLVFGQPSLHERGLERVEHLLAVGLRRYQAAAIARTCCYLVSGHSYLTGFPMSTIYGKRSVPVLSVRHPQIFCSVDQWSLADPWAGMRIGRSASCPVSGSDAIIRYRPVSP